MNISRIAAFAVLFVVTSVILLGSIELALRLKNLDMRNYDIEMWRYSKELKHISKNPILGHDHIPSSSAELQSVHIRINAEGLRGAEISTSQPDRRIMFIGSSITLGWGVEEEATLTEQLERKFEQDNKNAEVLNAGIGNYNAVRYVERYLTKLADIPVTDIVVQYFVNDAEVLISQDNFIIRNSELAVTLWRIYSQYVNGFGSMGSLIDHYKNVYKPTSQGYIEMRKSLLKLSEYAKKKGIRVYLAMTPDIHNMKDYPFTFIHDEMRRISSDLGWKYIDLYPAFSKSTPEEVWSMPGDPHPNALGHKWMADAIYPILAADN